VDVSRVGAQALEVDFSRDVRGLQFLDLAMDLGREPQNKVQGIIKPVRIQTGVQSQGTREKVLPMIEQATAV
jgi:hypothetical protein